MNIGSHLIASKFSQSPIPADSPPEKIRRLESETPVETSPSTTTEAARRVSLFVYSDTQVHALLTRLQQIAPTVALVMSPDDLDQDGLRNNLMINDDGSVEERPGCLFASAGSQPVILVLDFRHFEPRQLASLNSLFDDRPTLNGQPLGSHVSIISLVDDELFPDHISQTHKPGNDFSRRIAPGFRQGSLWNETLQSLPEKSSSVADVLNQKVPDSTYAATENPGKAIRTIDLSARDWREVLFGQACVDTKGRRCYLPGQLALAQPGETLVLKGAPWKDRGFQYALYKMIHSGSYYANGRDHQLPDNISWARQPLTEGDIARLKQGIDWVSAPGSHMAVINKDTLALVTRQSRFDQHGSLTGHDAFAQYLAGCQGIRVTSPLATSQWFELLNAIQKIGNPAPLAVYLDTPAQQPLPFRGPEQADPEKFFSSAVSPQARTLTGNSNVTLIRGDDALLRQDNAARGELMDTDTVLSEPLNIVITPELKLSALLEDLRLTSLKKGEFQRQEQPFVQALRTGRKLRVRGLEDNPTLARQLESLLLSPPSLIVNGERETFPQAQIEIIWPEGAKTDSVLWKQALDLGGLPASQQTPEELKAWLQQAFHLSQKDSGIVDRVAWLQDITSRMAPPGQQLSLGTDLLTKLVIQARQEQKRALEDALEPAHWSKALNSVLLKKYRSHPDLYNFLRLTVRNQEQSHGYDWIDQIALQRWLKTHPNPDAACIQQHFWSLTRHVNHTQINQLAAHIASWASPNLKVDPASPAFQFMLSQVRQAAGWPSSSQQHAAIFIPRHLCFEKQLQDICYESDLKLSRKDIANLGQLVGIVVASSQTTEEKQQRIATCLAAYPFPPQDCAPIAHTLLNPDDPSNHKYWYGRRKQRLMDKVRLHPVTLISGEPGAGKSFIAAEVAKALQGGSKAQTICCGPMTRLSDLMVKESLVLDPLTGDSQVKREEGPLLQWAKRTATAEHPAVLVIDEANLVDPALWNCLKGLYEPPASISDQHGHPWPVSEHHRIIMTGNPTSMTGRHLNSFLQNRAPQLYYLPLDDNFMASQIVDPVLQTLVAQVVHQCPALSRTEQAELTNRLSATTLSLFNQYRHLILGHEFSPRDLTDFGERLLRYLDSASQQGLAKCLQQDSPQQQEGALAGLIWQTMADTLGGLVPTSHRWQLDTLKTWYQVTYGADAALVEPHQLRFDYFFNRWQAQAGIGPDTFNLDNASVKALSRQVWLELDRLQARRQKPQEQIRGR
ncbi:MAG: ATP-binding protein, partial [Kistimonas sp.]|nr:ATP-binding protein [Kistimonas sp.]